MNNAEYIPGQSVGRLFGRHVYNINIFAALIFLQYAPMFLHLLYFSSRSIRLFGEYIVLLTYK